MRGRPSGSGTSRKEIRAFTSSWGGSNGWCGSGKLIQQKNGSSAGSEASQATVRSGDPVGVVARARHRIPRDLGRSRLAPALAGQDAREARHVLGVRAPEPRRVVVPADWPVRRSSTCSKPRHGPVDPPAARLFSR